MHTGLACSGLAHERNDALACPRGLADASKLLDLGEIWRGLLEGTLFIAKSEYVGDRCLTELEIRPAPHETHRTTGLLERVLLGDSQNALAIDRGVSASTICWRCSQDLRAMAYEHRASRTPLLLAMAAHAANGWQLAPAKVLWLTASSMTLEVTLPDMALRVALSEAERLVVAELLAGKSYAQTANVRKRSARTVANQLSAAFRKLGVSGRNELVASIIRRSCRPRLASPEAQISGLPAADCEGPIHDREPSPPVHGVTWAAPEHFPV